MKLLNNECAINDDSPTMPLRIDAIWANGRKYVFVTGHPAESCVSVGALIPRPFDTPCRGSKLRVVQPTSVSTSIL